MSDPEEKAENAIHWSEACRQIQLGFRIRNSTSLSQERLVIVKHEDILWKHGQDQLGIVEISGKMELATTLKQAARFMAMQIFSHCIHSPRSVPNVESCSAAAEAIAQRQIPHALSLAM
nr:hypothetical protein CFP56_72562 [Quercus suber]